MKKGRVVLVFWLVVLIAVLTATASYAWLAMSTTARMKGFEVELESDSLYLEISEYSDREYGNSVSFDRVVYYSDQEAVAFTGDTLFKNSIGRTDLPGGSMFQIIQSLRMFTQLPDNTRVLPGHGPETTIGYELATNPYLDR